MNKFKIFNDPIYGFINIPSTLIFDIIEHPYFQRLRRISQMGLSHYVYPGAHHTRFEHAIGAMYLMQRAISSLRKKHIAVSEKEEEALLIAILLHDIGHGPFSHTLEHSLVTGIKHEEISLMFMNQLNQEFGGQLSLAIEIFQGKYKRKFMNQLVSSQLDIDRLDYLKRDSFYTGVTEGNINSERILYMLNVVNDSLVVEEKGIYSIEKFLVARRLMYWMVYLHKTGLVSDYILVNTLKRAKELANKGIDLHCTGALKPFIMEVSDGKFDERMLSKFAAIDDTDILMALKLWIHHEDRILSKLSRSLLYRKLPKIIIRDEELSVDKFESIKKETSKKLDIDLHMIHYFVDKGSIENQAYDTENSSITILYKTGELKDITEASDQLHLMALSKPVVKHFVYYPK